MSSSNETTIATVEEFSRNAPFNWLRVEVDVMRHIQSIKTGKIREIRNMFRKIDEATVADLRQQMAQAKAEGKRSKRLQLRRQMIALLERMNEDNAQRIRSMENWQELRVVSALRADDAPANFNTLLESPWKKRIAALENLGEIVIDHAFMQGMNRYEEEVRPIDDNDSRETVVLEVENRLAALLGVVQHEEDLY